MNKLIKWFKNLFKKNKKLKINNDLKNTIFIDLGASSIKVCVNGKCKTFRSSIRKVLDENEITIQENAIEVNGEWFIVGENSIPTSAEILKFKKPFWEIFILYAIKLFENDSNFENNIEINLLLPFSQLWTKDQFLKKMRNTKYVLRDTKGVLRTYNLTLNGVFSEGEMSWYYINEISQYDGNIIIENLGHSTIDVVGFNSVGSRSKPVSLAYGMRVLLSEHNTIMNIGLSTKLSTWKAEGFKYPKRYEKAIREANRQYINNTMNELKLSVVGDYTPGNTKLVVCGGGAMELGDTIEEWIKDNELLREYEVEVLRDDDALYTDVLGMYVYVSKNIGKNITLENIKNENTIEDIALDKTENENVFENKNIENENLSNTKKTKKSDITRKLVHEMKNKGYEDKREVANILGMSYQTVCRYWG